MLSFDRTPTIHEIVTVASSDHGSRYCVQFTLELPHPALHYQIPLNAKYSQTATSRYTTKSLTADSLITYQGETS